MEPDSLAVRGSHGGQTPLARFIDHSETYGARVIERFARRIVAPALVVDLGAGGGRDLGIVREIHPKARTVAIEAGASNVAALSAAGHEVHALDIERDRLPFANGSCDLIMANQVLEHTKEIYWIFHEVTRSLKVGGRFVFGTPNVCSLHNRLLMLFGFHPTQHKLYSAHVRPFSKRDTITFLDVCFPNGYAVEAFAGSQFYPFSPAIARVLSDVFPGAAFSIFFMIRKLRPYEGEFLQHPVKAALETNFWLGGQDQSQYASLSNARPPTT